jgi:aspartyl-tRNA(Asn)/glutamyl-tRNA(Gln) amidotransferase subunit C
MAVTEADVRHVAELARLGVDERRLPALVQELNGILGHMQVLQAVDTSRVAPTAGVGSSGTPLRPDSGPAIPLARPRELIAPLMRDGFYLVPRLATHADSAGLDATEDLE